ncbi:DUF3563 domain-containing protein [archaeon]|nr:DUF3563 domain-containing protein [archaeon]
MLTKLLSFLKNIFTVDERKLKERYLNESVDIYELEYRMKQLDKQSFKGT